jgi:DNA repair protein RecO (recombination protein O)
MNQINTQAIILGRTDYGEADRILTLLTPDHGKLSLMAKGVRRIRSKLAGGIELFSVSDISYIRGRGEVGTLTSTRLVKHFGQITSDVTRTMLGYELIRMLHTSTEAEPEPIYFELLLETFAALDDPAVEPAVVRTWFVMQLIRHGGHSPNLHTDTRGARLAESGRYSFSFDDMTFEPRESGGSFTSAHIKFLRLGFAGTPPHVLQKVTGIDALIKKLDPFVRTIAGTYLHGVA